MPRKKTESNKLATVPAAQVPAKKTELLRLAAGEASIQEIVAKAGITLAEFVLWKKTHTNFSLEFDELHNGIKDILASDAETVLIRSGDAPTINNYQKRRASQLQLTVGSDGKLESVKAIAVEARGVPLYGSVPTVPLEIAEPLTLDTLQDVDQYVKWVSRSTAEAAGMPHFTYRLYGDSEAPECHITSNGKSYQTIEGWLRWAGGVKWGIIWEPPHIVLCVKPK